MVMVMSHHVINVIKAGPMELSQKKKKKAGPMDRVAYGDNLN